MIKCCCICYKRKYIKNIMIILYTYTTIVPNQRVCRFVRVVTESTLAVEHLAQEAKHRSEQHAASVMKGKQPLIHSAAQPTFFFFGKRRRKRMSSLEYTTTAPLSNISRGSLAHHRLNRLLQPIHTFDYINHA
jgi:hypothetical protein